MGAERVGEQSRLADQGPCDKRTGYAVRRPIGDDDLVTGPDVAFARHTQIGSWPVAAAKRFRKAGITDTQPEFETRQSRLCDLEERRPDGPPLADDSARHLQAADGEVLTERRWSEITAEL